MPKQRITKEMIVDAAFIIAREHGMEQVMVKTIAAQIGCSVQPIYSYCTNMKGLRKDVTDQTNVFIQQFIASHIDKKDFFRSIGQAYIQLAKEEPNLFKIFILQARDGISSLDELYDSQATPQALQTIAKQLKISSAQAKQLHLHMLIYTIGLGTIFSVTSPGISAEEIFAQQELAYQAFLIQTKETDAT